MTCREAGRRQADEGDDVVHNVGSGSESWSRAWSGWSKLVKMSSEEVSPYVEAKLEQSWLPLYVFQPKVSFPLPGSCSFQADELRNAPLLTNCNVSTVMVDEQNLPTWPSRQRFPEKVTKGGGNKNSAA